MDLYHCTPSQLDREDMGRVSLHLSLWNIWQKHEQERRTKGKR